MPPQPADAVAAPTEVTPGAPEPEAPATGSDRFRPDIEGLRAIAVVAVVLFHAGVPGFGGGYVGVDVFFVISGFLITGQMLRDKEKTAGFGFAEFYARRIRRLLPLATLVIVVVLAGSALVHSPIYQEAVGKDAQASALFYSNIRFADQATDYFQEDAPPSPYQHFWSLSVEEQFYFVWPALFALTLAGVGLGMRARRRRLAPLLAVIIVVSFAYCVWLTGESQPKAFFWLPTRAWELGIGALLAVGAGVLARLGRTPRVVLGWVGLAAVGAAVVLYDATTTFPGMAAAVPVVGTACVIAAGTGAGRSFLGRTLALSPFQMGGRYSYSLYLWHWPVLVLGADAFESIATNWKRAMVLVVVVAVPATLLSYHLLENPVRRSGYLRARPRATLALGGALVATSLVGVLVYGLFATSGELTSDRLSPTTDAVVGPEMPITEFVPSNVVPTLRVATEGTDFEFAACSDTFSHCTFGDPDAETSIAWFGDSHANHWGGAIDVIAKEHDFVIDRITAGACGSFFYPTTGNPEVSCPDWREDAVAEIEADQPDLIVHSTHVIPAYQRDSEEFADGVRASIRRLSEIAPVAVMAQTPQAAEEVPSCLAVHLEDAAACEPRADSRQLAAINDELATIAEEEGAAFIDPTPWLCTEERCPAITANILVYRDRHHLSREFVTSRADVLHDELTKILDEAGAAR
jgi:peptidoglycan/LPS O-acetylase OafA/YrhL